MDVKRLIAEVAAQNGIRVESGDPIFAVVTINKIALDEATLEVQERIRERIAEFETSFLKAERRAGGVLAQQVMESAEQMRQGLQNDIHIAGLKARDYVHLVNEAHRRPALIRWSAIGLVAGAKHWPCRSVRIRYPVAPPAPVVPERQAERQRAG